jgi:glycosyltransferase involved in cell wall biosynthesis
VNLSLVIPLRDEEENVRRLLEVVPASLEGNPHLDEVEIIIVDDGSVDATFELLGRWATPLIRVLRLAGAEGKEAALAAGVDQARYDIVGFMDGDLQASPEDLAELLPFLDEGYACVSGRRVDRQDGWSKRVSSRIANGIRAWALGDDFRDINCPLKVVRRDVLLRVPRFRAWHRYVPVLVAREGYRVREVPIRHYPRIAGRSKYGIWNRVWIGLWSLLVVSWLMRNRVEYQLEADDGED